MANALNAKNLPFTEPGAGLALGGVNSRNLYAKYDKLRAHNTEKEGGSKQLWENLSRYTTTKNAANLDKTQASLFNDYIRTGVKPAGLRDETAATAMDWGLREAGRFQQHKPISLLEKIGGPLLTIAASAIPVIGPYAGAAVGGYMGQRHGGGVLGGLLGAAGGYLGGKSIANAGGVSGIYNSAKNNLGELFGNSGGFANYDALGLGGALKLPGLANAPAVTGYGASGLGLTGANLSLPGLVNALPSIPVSGYGNSAIGGDPKSLYNPQSLGGPGKPSMVDKLPSSLGGLPALPSAQGQQPAAPPSIGGPTETPNALVALPPPSSPITQPGTFEAALMGGGRAPGNSLAVSGMGAGLLPQGRMERVPGYQLRPFANYLARP